MGLKRTSNLAAGVSLARAKKHLELSGGADSHHDSQVSSLVLAATKVVEDRTGRALVSQTWEMTLDRFPLTGPRRIVLPRPPLSSVSSITYVDSDGASQTLSSSNYRVSTHREPGTVEESYDTTWPTTRDIQEAVKVTFVAGYANLESVPEALKQAILLIVGHWFGNRGDEEMSARFSLPPAAVHLIEMYRVGAWVGYYGLR